MIKAWLANRKQFIIAGVIFSLFGTGAAFALPYTSSDAILNPTCAPGDVDCYVAIDALPSQTGNSGKFLTTNGTAASWATVTGMGIGNAVASGTSGSVLFVDASGNLAQDNANFNYNNATDTLTVPNIAGLSNISSPNGQTLAEFNNSYFAVTTDSGGFSTPYITVSATAINLAGLGGGEIALSSGSLSFFHGTKTVFNSAIELPNLTASKVVFTNGSKNLTSSGTVGVDQGGTGLGSLGTANQILGVNNAGTALEYKTISVNAVSVANDVGVTLSGANAIVINLPTASATVRGVLANSDWTTFNDKENALTFSTGLTRSTNTITSDLSTGIAGGQSAIGGTAASENLTLSSTSNATKGKILFGTSAYDESINSLGIGLTSNILGLVQTQSSTNTIAFRSTYTGTSGNNAAPTIQMFVNDGAAMTSGDLLGEVSFGGIRSGTTFATGVRLKAFAEENFTASTAASYLTFETITSGSTSSTEKMRLSGSGNLAIGNTDTTQAKVLITGGTLTGSVKSLLVTGTVPSTGDVQGVRFNINSTGTGVAQTAVFTQLSAGYSGSSITIGHEVDNLAASTGNDLRMGTTGANFFGNAGFNSFVLGTTTGLNVGTKAEAYNGNLNIGSFGRAIGTKNGATNVGVVGHGRNTGTTPTQVGGWFTLANTTPVWDSAALVADNGDQTSPIFLAKDNGTTIFSIVDGGSVELANGNYIGRASTHAISFDNSLRIVYNSGVPTGTVAGHVFTASGSSVSTSGTAEHIVEAITFAPASGTAVFNAMRLSPTINQTGGANGITRGIYVNPTLTAAADFRAIETTAGRVVFNSDIASNYAGTFFNDGNDDNRYGLLIQAGADTPSANRWIQFNDGDGTDQGSICYTGGQANICAPSDERLKTNIADTALSLNTLRNIKVRDFTYLSNLNQTVHGFIAQELASVYPNAVSIPADPNETWKVSYAQLTPLIVKSIQEIDASFKSLDASKENTLAYLVKKYVEDVGTKFERIFARSIEAESVRSKEFCTSSGKCLSEQALEQLIDWTQSGMPSSSPVAVPEPVSVSPEAVSEETPIETISEEPVVQEETPSETAAEEPATQEAISPEPAPVAE